MLSFDERDAPLPDKSAVLQASIYAYALRMPDRPSHRVVPTAAR